MMIASIESFFGNLWACGLCFVLGCAFWAFLGSKFKKKVGG